MIWVYAPCMCDVHRFCVWLQGSLCVSGWCVLLWICLFVLFRSGWVRDSCVFDDLCVCPWFGCLDVCPLLFVWPIYWRVRATMICLCTCFTAWGYAHFLCVKGVRVFWVCALVHVVCVFLICVGSWFRCVHGLRSCPIFVFCWWLLCFHDLVYGNCLGIWPLFGCATTSAVICHACVFEDLSVQQQ